ncbi:gamma-glutamyl-gamma-aminobutyrate hydrolase family protein [Fructilactobacillus sp. Tb1]|uniref:gamma-glutamyl-gamma-aminobutyrate hydrolase family protein n=1 Tax=Fructilactobacillus sp. Tb1 TaxID=3422304 RepID=UPI003D2A5F1B
MKIGITANVNLGEPNKFCQPFANVTPSSFIEVVTKHNQIPVILPVVPVKMVPELVAMVDAVIIPGGQDIDACFFNADSHDKSDEYFTPHDEFELAVAKEAIRTHKPLLGICRGLQIINVALGGDLYQDLPEQHPSNLNHEQRGTDELFAHSVQVSDDSYLVNALGHETPVNSRHHQGLRKIGNGLHVVAHASDGVVEAVEDDNGFVTGVQWHPEDLWKADAKQDHLFSDFFNRAKVKNNQTV